MEELIPALLYAFGEIFGDVCCSALVTLLTDGVTGVAAYRSYQKRQVRRTARAIGAEPPPVGIWPWLFWLLLPVALLFTSFFVGRWIFGRH